MTIVNLHDTGEFHTKFPVKTLHIPIQKKWFDMILSGEKKEEYREISDHWITRLIDTKTQPTVGDGFKNFHVVKFKNGYARNSPSATVQFLSVHIGFGNQAWGATPGQKYFVITLGEIIKKP